MEDQQTPDNFPKSPIHPPDAPVSIYYLFLKYI